MSDKKTNSTNSGFGKQVDVYPANVDSQEEAAPGDSMIKMIQALERSPEFEVPPAFAARVARLAVAQPLPVRSAWAGFGPRIALGSLGLLLAAMFAFAAHATPSYLNLRFDLELFLLVELAAVGLMVPHLTSRD